MKIKERKKEKKKKEHKLFKNFSMLRFLSLYNRFVDNFLCLLFMCVIFPLTINFCRWCFLIYSVLHWMSFLSFYCSVGKKLLKSKMMMGSAWWKNLLKNFLKWPRLKTLWIRKSKLVNAQESKTINNAWLFLENNVDLQRTDLYALFLL